MTGLTQALAAFVSKPTFGSNEQGALAVAKTGFMDTIATMMAGHNEPVVNIVRQFLANTTTPAEAPVPFLGTMHPAAQAAFITAVAGHALDYDDVALSGHPSTALVPAILAEGFVLNSTGLDALRAYIVGYEVWAELVSRETDQYHLKGWHPTGVFGAVGAAAAVSYLRRLNEADTRQALAIAASLASGLVANFGTMTKPFHAGRAAAHGIEAVRLSMLGMTSAADVFEHPAGYLNALSKAGRVDRTRPADTLGKTLRILETGLSIKRYPVCYSSHRTIDGVLKIVEAENLQPKDIEQVHITTGVAQASMLRNHYPVTGLEAKFSAEFAVASAVVARDVGLAQLTDSFATRADVSGLFSKVSLETVDTVCPLDPAFALTDRVTIETNDGRKFDSGEIRFPLGNALNPIDAAGLKRKFMDCLETGKAANSSIKGADIALYDRIATLESLPSIRQLFKQSPKPPCHPKWLADLGPTQAVCPSMSYSVVWFKRDLRLNDHAALTQALAHGPVLCLYIVEPSLWRSPDAATQHYHFLLESLRDLYLEFKRRGERLHVVCGEAVEVLDKLYALQPFHTLHSHQETGNALSYTRDRNVAHWCRTHAIPWRQSQHFGVTRGLKDRDLWKDLWDQYVGQPCLPAPATISCMALPWTEPALPTAADLGLDRAEPTQRQRGGRTLAQQVLDSFLNDRSQQYRGGISSPLSAPTACSRLSAYLTFGCLSLREVVQATTLQLKALSPAQA